MRSSLYAWLFSTFWALPPLSGVSFIETHLASHFGDWAATKWDRDFVWRLWVSLPVLCVWLLSKSFLPWRHQIIPFYQAVPLSCALWQLTVPEYVLPLLLETLVFLPLNTRWFPFHFKFTLSINYPYKQSQQKKVKTGEVVKFALLEGEIAAKTQTWLSFAEHCAQLERAWLTHWEHHWCPGTTPRPILRPRPGPAQGLWTHTHTSCRICFHL